MQIFLIAIGTRMDTWVEEGFRTFAKRLPRECQLMLVEIPVAKRSKSTSIEKCVIEEGEQLINAIPGNARAVMLDVKGEQLSTSLFAQRVEKWMQCGQNIAIVIGGPDGLSEKCKQRADEIISLSSMTLPHGLVRIVVAEQVYRAWSILQNHPYHRE